MNTSNISNYNLSPDLKKLSLNTLQNVRKDSMNPDGVKNSQQRIHVPNASRHAPVNLNNWVSRFATGGPLSFGKTAAASAAEIFDGYLNQEGKRLQATLADQRIMRKALTALRDEIGSVKQENKTAIHTIRRRLLSLATVFGELSSPEGRNELLACALLREAFQHHADKLGLRDTEHGTRILKRIVFSQPPIEQKGFAVQKQAIRLITENAIIADPSNPHQYTAPLIRQAGAYRASSKREESAQSTLVTYLKRTIDFYPFESRREILSAIRQYHNGFSEKLSPRTTDTKWTKELGRVAAPILMVAGAAGIIAAAAVSGGITVAIGAGVAVLGDILSLPEGLNRFRELFIDSDRTVKGKLLGEVATRALVAPFKSTGQEAVPITLNQFHDLTEKILKKDHSGGLDDVHRQHFDQLHKLIFDYARVSPQAGEEREQHCSVVSAGGDNMSVASNDAALYSNPSSINSSTAFLA